MTALEALVERLELQGVAIGGETLFAGSEPDLPGIGTGFLTVIETGGYRPLGTHTEGLNAIERPSFQVTVRAEDYDVASIYIRAAYSALTFSNTLVGDVFFLLMAPVQAPFSLPNDANGRVRLAFNVDAIHR